MSLLCSSYTAQSSVSLSTGWFGATDPRPYSLLISLFFRFLLPTNTTCSFLLSFPTRQFSIIIILLTLKCIFSYQIFSHLYSSKLLSKNVNTNSTLANWVSNVRFLKNHENFIIGQINFNLKQIFNNSSIILK